MSHKKDNFDVTLKVQFDVTQKRAILMSHKDNNSRHNCFAPVDVWWCVLAGCRPDLGSAQVGMYSKQNQTWVTDCTTSNQCERGCHHPRLRQHTIECCILQEKPKALFNCDVWFD